MIRKSWLVIVVGLFFVAAPAQAQEKGEAPQWIVVTAPAYRDALTPLCDQRRAQGMRVVIVQTTDVLTAKQVEAGEGSPLRDHVVDLCRKAKGPSYVLLVGAVKSKDPAGAAATVVPPLRGEAGRMKGQPSDNAFGSVDKDLAPKVAVGRFPANTVLEAQQMVKKTLVFERDGPSALWRNRLTLMVGNPGGRSAIEKQFGEILVQSLVKDRFQRAPASFTTRAVVLMENSPFFLPRDKIRETTLRYLEEGQLFSVYLGHSGAFGFWSGLWLDRFIDREDWGKKNFPGILFSCGCFGCQLKDGDEGYGLTAMRNPAGPVAVIGAHGESFAAMGQFAIDGLLECIGRTNPPERLGEYWLAITRHIAAREMDPITFFLYDQGDGSRGTIPLAMQRREHLEMWMLLGDPALRLPVRQPTIGLDAVGTALPGKSLKVRGSLPAGFKGTSLRLTLERPLGSEPPGLQPLPREPDKLDAIILANHERANSLVLQTLELQARDGMFEAEFRLPDALPWPRINIRAFAATGEQSALGVLPVVVAK